VHRDPTVFYLESSKEAAQFREYRCDEFRHKQDEIFAFNILALGNGAEGTGYLSVLVSAKNLPDPMKGGLKIKWQTKDYDLLEAGQRILQAARLNPRRSKT
jgi:hypothetical protein